MKYYPGREERIGFDFYADIAVRIVSIREEKGLTQKKLTELLKWPAGKLQNLEAVKRRIMAQDLEDLSRALDVSINYLLEAYNDSPLGDCLYLVWTDSCKKLKLYVEAPNSRVAVFELEKKFKESKVCMWSNARDRATVRLVGVPVDEKELRDRRGTYEEENLLERGEMDDKI
ncbi:MAG: helix-turn-helix transcriptional regulator [Lachnospiraceae bacterium]|nr:helix-turn-helix transcriptional regulator [Lachnospiraceae bacterium]